MLMIYLYMQNHTLAQLSYLGRSVQQPCSEVPPTRVCDSSLRLDIPMPSFSFLLRSKSDHDSRTNTK